MFMNWYKKTKFTFAKPMMSIEEAYQSLGLQQGCTKEELKSAYRQLVMIYHPDKNPGNKDAEEMMKQINNASEIVADYIASGGQPQESPDSYHGIKDEEFRSWVNAYEQKKNMKHLSHKMYGRWYKTAKLNDINNFRDELFNLITENVQGDWIPKKFKYFKETHISASMDGTAKNSIGTKIGYFDIRLTIFLTRNVIRKIICAVYGKEFTGEFPEKNWMTQKMFSNKHQEIKDISEDTLYSIEDIPVSIQNAINKFFGYEEYPGEELNPDINPITERNYELV